MSKISKEVLLEKVGILMGVVASLRAEVNELRSLVVKQAPALSRSGYQPIVGEEIPVPNPPRER